MTFIADRHWNLLTAGTNQDKQSMQTNELLLAFEHKVSNKRKRTKYMNTPRKPLRLHINDDGEIYRLRIIT